MSEATRVLPSVSQETLIDLASFSAGTALLGSRFMIGGPIGAAAVAVGNYFSHGHSTVKKVIAAAVCLSLGALATPTLAGWAGVALTLKEACMIAGMAAALKAATLALIRFASVKMVKSPEDAQNLYSVQLGPLHDYYSNHMEAFSALDLRTQLILQKRFAEAGYPYFGIGGFSEVGEGFTREDAKQLGQNQINFFKTKTERETYVQLAFEQDHYIHQTIYEPTDFAKISIPADPSQIQTLSDAKIKWIHRAIYCTKLVPRNLDMRFALAERFYNLQLSTPSAAIFLNTMPTLPKSLENPESEAYLITWLHAHYRNHFKEWKALPLETQHDYNKAFQAICQRSCALFPSEDNFPQTPEITKALYEQYTNNKGLWYALPETLQQRLNAEFESPLPLIHEATEEDIKRAALVLHALPSLHKHMDSKQKNTLINRCQALHIPLTPKLDRMRRNQENAKIGWGLLASGVALFVLKAFGEYSPGV